MTSIRTPSASARPGERAVLVTAALGTMLMPLNSTMIAVALPDVVTDLDVSLESTAWLVSGYLIAQAALQPLGGKLGDRIGRRPILVGGLVAFALASLGAALAPSLGILIAARVLQAVVGGLVFPNALALVRELVPETRRGAGFGILGSGIGLAAAIGPALGGLLVAAGGWRAIFLVNLPWIALALVLTLRSVPARLAVTARGRFDIVGAIVLSSLLGLGAWLLNPGEVPGWSRLAAAAALLALVVLFVRFELRQPDPIFEPRFLRVVPFAAATGSVGFSNLALYGTLLAVPVLLADRPGWSAGEIGLAVAALPFPMFALSPLGGRLADRAGRRAAAVSGLTLLAAAMVPLAVEGAEIAATPLIACLLVAGAGMGLSNAAVQAAGIEAIAAEHAGVASGIFSTGRYMGGIAAASLVATLVTDGADYGLLFTIEAAAAVISVLLAAALPGRARATIAEPSVESAAVARASP